MKRYMTVMPYHDFKEKMDKVSREQCIVLVQYAIANKIIDFDKFKYLQERTDIDPLRAIQMEQEAKED